MMRKGWMLAGLSVLVLGGCLSLGGPTPPSRFFLLSAPQPGPPAAAGAAQGMLRLPTVTLPAYLDRPQLVTRVGNGELHIAPYWRWGEPLADGITRVLAAVLRRQLPQLVVTSGPGEAAPDSLRLVVAIDRCEGDEADGKVHLQAHWRLEDGAVLTRGAAKLSEPWAGSDADALVASQDRLLLRFGTDLAEAVTAATGSKVPASQR